MGDSDDGMESFEINDYDLQSALYPGRRRKFTKEQRIYGMWADSDEEDEELGGRGFGFSGKKRKDYSTPVNFISGGVKVGDKITENIDDDEDQVSSPSTSKNDLEDEPIQINFNRSRTGLGGAKFGKKPKPSGIFNEAVDFAGIRSAKRPAVVTGKGFAEWERYTRGIGSKLLEKMGYQQGRGLGKEGQGISKPVEARLRPGRGALGAYGPEAKGPKRPGVPGQAVQSESDEDQEEAENEKRPTGQWRKNGNKRRKPKYKYRTVDEIIAEGGTLGKRMGALGLGGEHSSTKVIDMTGKEQKVYSGYEALSTRKREPEIEEVEPKKKAFDVPELTYNLDLLVEITEDEILRNNRQLTFLKDQNVALKYEINELATSLDVEKEQQKKAAEVLELLETFRHKEKNNELSLDDCSGLFERLQNQYYAEYKLYGLSDLAVSNVLPLIRNAFDGWDPIADPDYCLSLMKEWRDILEDPNSFRYRGGLVAVNEMDPYHRLVWEVWMPPVRKTALRWKPRDCEPMLKLVEVWLPLLPGWILENLLELVVLPRIQTEVENWNPLTDTVPLHSWLHPWLPLMGDRLQPVYPTIRQKLSRALTQWHPRDPSAKNVLKPWKEVFSQGSLSSFLAQNIIPKLELCLSAFIVNPADQRLEAWNWIMDWQDMVSPEMMAQLLLRYFFPKWQEALFTWLSCVSPNYKEISEWYSGWKSMFSQELLDIPMIKGTTYRVSQKSEQFTHALTMMNRAVSGGGVRKEPPAESVNPKASLTQHKKDMEFLSGVVKSGAPSTFKDLVEKRAVDRGITFLPVPNKIREGKPVYRFGSELIYIDRQVVFVQKETGIWEPMGLEDLIQLALNS